MFGRLATMNPGAAARRVGLALIALMAVLIGAQSAAEARVYVGVGVNFGPPAYYYPYRPHPYYYGPPTVVYAPPPVIYEPPPVVYATPPVVYAPGPTAPLSATPTSEPYQAENGQTCREYQSEQTINGIRQQLHGTACLQPDGSWRIVN